jgi:type VI secretion system protein ImpI
MPLRLAIENIPNLPDGGPISYEITGKRGIDIGRDAHLDWVLPDPSRVVSGKHCEVRYKDGAYWLRDVSTNGTFVNQGELPVREPHRLRDGDRLDIGPYIIYVEVSGEEAGPLDRAAADPRSDPNSWFDAEDAAPPEHPDSFRERSKPNPILSADPIDHFVGDLSQGLSRRSPVETPNAAAPEKYDIWGNPIAPVLPYGSAPPPAAPVGTPSPSAAAPAVDPFPAPPRSVPPFAGAEDGAEFKRRFAKGAGIAPGDIEARNAGDLAELLGVLMQLCAGNVSQLLAARAESKSAMRSMNQSIVRRERNNPLRYAPTAHDALVLMFGRSTTSYVDAPEAFEQSFKALKKHQMDSFAAVQEAIQILLADLDPAALERALGASEKKGAFFIGDKLVKARLWDEFTTRWKKKIGAHDGGLFGTFMRVFGEAYDKKSE